MADASGSVAAADNYNYDAYGMLLGGNPTTASPAATNYLYTGEQYDNNLQQYYLRARYYDPANGRFNRTDPYAGNLQDPQSLHKYLYCHANPVNNMDPTGLFSFGEMRTVAMITGLLSGLVYGTLAYAGGAGLEQSYNSGVKWFWRGFVVALVVYGATWAIHSLWILLFSAGTGAYGGLEHAEEYGICSHGVLRSLLEGTKLVAHHITSYLTDSPKSSD